MKTIFCAVALIVGALTGPPAAAQGVAPLPADQIQTERNLIRIADALDDAIDAGRWDEARTYFVADVFVDVAALGGGAAGSVKADALIRGWAAAMPDGAASLHLRGDHLVNFQTRDRAVMTSHAHAWTWAADAGEPEAEVWGVYEYRFERVGTGWKISSFTVRNGHRRGGDWPMAAAPAPE